MNTMRRFLVLTPIAFGVTAVVSVIFLGSSDWRLETIGVALGFALVVTVVVLAAVLAGVGLLRLLSVRNAWAVLGLAVVLFAALCVLLDVADTLWGEGGEEWDQLFLVLAALASIPTFLAYTGGLMVGDLRARTARAETAAV